MWEAISNVVMFIWLFSLMFQMGASITVKEIAESLRRGATLWKAVSANFLLVPIIAFGLLLLFRPNPIVAAGFLTGVVFSGAPLAPTFTVLAKGDMPLSIVLMVILAGLSVVISPALLKLLMAGLSRAEPLSVNYLKIMTVVALGQLFPLAAGLGLNGWKPAVVRRIARPLQMFNTALLVAVCSLVIGVHYHDLAIFGWRAIAGMAGLFLACLVIGWAMGGPQRDQRKALSLNTTVRNIPAAMVVASASFGGTAAIAAVFAYSLFSIAGTLLVALCMGRKDTCSASA